MTEQYLLVDPDNIKTVVSTKYAVEGYLVLKESTFVFGPPKHLKTFLVLSWSLCIATGRDWFGHKVRQQKVLYFIGEGDDAFIGRIKAWQNANKVSDLNQYFKVVKHVPNLFDGSLKTTIEQIKAQGFTPDVVVIDTLNRAMGAAKETTDDFNKIFSSIDALMKHYLPNVTLIVVGHTRKSDLIYRGPQVIAGDCDNMIYVERIGKTCTVNVYCEFSRNAAEFDDFAITCTKTPVTTDIGPQNFLVVTNLSTASEAKLAVDPKAELKELAYKTLLSCYENADTWTRQTAWFETTKDARGGKLGNSTFSDITKELVNEGRVQINAAGLYQVVLDQAPKQTEQPSPPRHSSSSRSSSSPSKERGVGGMTGAAPRSTPGVPGVNSNGSRTEENLVVQDKAAIALEHLLKRPA